MDQIFEAFSEYLNFEIIFLPMMVVRVMTPNRTDVAIEMTVNSYPSLPPIPIVALKFFVSFCV